MTRHRRTPSQKSRLLGAALMKAEARLAGEKGRGGEARVEEEARLHNRMGRDWEAQKAEVRPHLRNACHEHCGRWDHTGGAAAADVSLVYCCAVSSTRLTLHLSTPTPLSHPLRSTQTEQSYAPQSVSAKTSQMASLLSQTRRAPCQCHFHVPLT